LTILLLKEHPIPSYLGDADIYIEHHRDLTFMVKNIFEARKKNIDKIFILAQVSNWYILLSLSRTKLNDIDIYPQTIRLASKGGAYKL
jgi:hypothetical protein